MNKLDIFVKRLKKQGIEVELAGNFPWIYLTKVNGHRVEETFQADHGFTIAFHPIKPDKDLQPHFTDIKHIFEIIRKYNDKPKLHDRLL